jgi:hypothetical protein
MNTIVSVTYLVRSLTETGDNILALAERKRIGDDTRTLKVAGRSTKCAAYLVDHQVYDAQTGYAWLRAARDFYHSEMERGNA